MLLDETQAPFPDPVFHMWLQRGTKECMRQGDWKLVRDVPGGPFELFNLNADPYEERDLANDHPEKTTQMIRVLETHMKAAQGVPWKRPGTDP